MKRRWVLPIVASILSIFLFTVPVSASVPQPTLLEIQEISVYENTRESGDQLYIVQYYISQNSTYNANQLYIFRLFDESDDELASTTPYPYYNQGYGMGVVAFYLDSTEAPTWETAVYVTVIGNPLADWDGGIPSTTMAIIDWNTGEESEMQAAASGKILELAATLTIYWGTEMTTVTQGITVLTDYGANYFLQVIPYLSDVAPYVLGQYVFSPDYPIDPKPPSNTYADTLVDGIRGTIFDVTPTARSWGVDRGLLTAFLWYAAAIFFVIMLIRKKGLTKGAMLIVWPFVVAGSWFGIPLMVAILGSFFWLLAGTWMFYKGAT